ncbi:MAG TPA: glutaminyl-peptide cyclotransferase [Thermoanaerobaculia bacterium]|nr:glutaminyl-peptide cyclotransferase [Thermoanaerobaculia bacterium]
MHETAPRRSHRGLLVFGLISFLAGGCAGEPLAGRATVAAAPPAPAVTPERLRARVVAEYPHDPRSYTQGLLWHEGVVYESRGRYGQSGVRRYRLDGEVLTDVEIPDEYFGEGLAMVGERLYQLTWQEGVVFVYEAESLEQLERLAFRGEGWGLAFDGESLIVSDGTHVLTFLDPATLTSRRRLVVRQQGAVRDALNELEYVDGAIWANVYQIDEIVRIDPESGAVTAVVDASGLLDGAEVPRAEVLNGIAWRPDNGTFLLTGKYWPKMFEVVLEPVDDESAK